LTNGEGMTVKELVLRLDGKLDAFIMAHEARHNADAAADAAARGDPAASSAGRAITAQIREVSTDVAELARTVDSHERTIQRMIGAMVLVSALGLGTLLLVFLRLTGVVG